MFYLTAHRAQLCCRSSFTVKATSLGIVQLPVNTNIESASHMAATQAFRHGQDDPLKFKLSIRMGKKGDLSDFESDVVVCAS